MWRSRISSKIQATLSAAYVLATVSGNVSAQPTSISPEIAGAMSLDGQTELPSPSKYNPSYWSMPEYARTPYQCVGDDVIGDYIASRLHPRRGQLNFHVSTQGFVSVTLLESDENAIDSVNLSPAERDQLRTLLNLRFQRIEETQAGRKWVFRIASMPAVVTQKLLVWLVYFAGEASSEFVSDPAEETKQHLRILADQLRSSARLYRSVKVLKSPSGQQFVRYLYAVQPSDRELTMLRLCVYARR